MAANSNDTDDGPSAESQFRYGLDGDNVSLLTVNSLV
jgi:hypothetical protein